MTEKAWQAGCVLCRDQGSPSLFARIEGETSSPSERSLGLFGVLRELRSRGQLSAMEEGSAARLVERAYELHDEPPPRTFMNGAAHSWFKTHLSTDGTCSGLGALCDAVVRLAGRHGVEMRVVRTDDPGDLTYEDALQVVAHQATA